MKNEVIEVMKPGMLTTIQDLGRTGYQQYGMVVSGAMDLYALRMANILVGNDEQAAGLEITLIGPVLKIKNDCVIAVTGGDISPKLNGKPIPMWTSIHVPANSLLEFGRLKKGCRCYLAVSGGFEVPLVMGSRSTYLRAGIGGFYGRALQAGDLLARRVSNGSKPPLKNVRRKLDKKLIPLYSETIELRVILGPQWGNFTKESQNHFLTNNFQITPQSDRMGYRLKGTPLELYSDIEQITDPIPQGAIQVPPGGNPILLLSDRQTTGGYPKIATVISVDLPKIAQAKPGDIVHFKPISVEESHRLLYEQEKSFRILKSYLN